jgi:hypothetical protein
MKALPNVLAGVGILMLVVAVAGIFSANPSRVDHIKVTTIVLGANTFFLLAILGRLNCKK